ncbi:MAG: DUF4159 domain-containing protein [Cyanobacteria bacterium P01_F01_bin.56]
MTWRLCGLRSDRPGPPAAAIRCRYCSYPYFPCPATMTRYLSHSDSASMPTIAPLQRLAVRNGLLLDAERWRVAHDYHRQRQNLHYQALHLPGIVCGLEVAVAPPPEDVSARYRDGRWLQISPGVAIDAHGNLVVIDQPVKIRLASTTADEAVWIYLVVCHVDPEGLQRSQPAEIIAETFRIDEKKNPPSPLEVELCRVFLSPDETSLTPAVNVFQPAPGELDLRYRQAAQLRPQATVHAAYVTTGLAAEDERIHDSLQALSEAASALYPTLSMAGEVAAINLTQLLAGVAAADSSERLPSELAECDLLYLTHRQSLSLDATATAYLRRYLEQGSVLFVELPSRDGNFEEVNAVVRELAVAADDLQGSQRFADLRSQLESELAAVNRNLEDRLANAQRSLLTHLFPSHPSLTLQDPDDEHPLRRAPFAFSQWPSLQGEPLRLFASAGLVLALGDLSHSWSARRELNLPRDRVRAAQELGINLLQFAWHRHHRTQMQQPPPPS